jgi:putative phosphoesterase
MKIVVISDSHGNIANIKHVMEFALKIKCMVVIHCGDWQNPEAVKTVLSYKIPVYGVAGNADIDDAVKNEYKDFLKFEIDRRKIGVIHDIKKLKSEDSDLDIIFFGHWQKQRDTFWKGIRAVNPGALENNISFAIYDTDINEVEFLDLKYE